MAAILVLVSTLVVWAPTGTAQPKRSMSVFKGLGAWIDAYDYAPRFQQPDESPAVVPESIDDLAALGVRTLYLQAAMVDERAPERIVDRDLVGAFLTRAHELGINVVAWFVPLFEDVDTDLAHIRAVRDFRVRGQRFDALALDIEWTQGVRDVGERNRRVVEEVRRTRELVGDQALGAIVYPAVQLEVVNPTLWPGFPYHKLAGDVDVWMPMAYWTLRSGEYRDAYRYTEESVRRLRANLRDESAPVHAIGGIADTSTVADYEGFLRAVRDIGAIGWSVYDFNTSASSVWPRLRAGPIGSTTTPTSTTPATAPGRRQ